MDNLAVREGRGGGKEANKKQSEHTASLNAVFRSQKRTKLLHTSGACPGDGSYYY